MLLRHSRNRCGYFLMRGPIVNLLKEERGCGSQRLRNRPALDGQPWPRVVGAMALAVLGGLRGDRAGGPRRTRAQRPAWIRGPTGCLRAPCPPATTSPPTGATALLRRRDAPRHRTTTAATDWRPGVPRMQLRNGRVRSHSENPGPLRRGCRPSPERRPLHPAVGAGARIDG